ncbi:MAG: tetratricopeptide repeat protein [Alphaproteobacteria bacterium]|nr:tetratricopeptide repeat protein [Alphaproteobacteria bacterium]
MSCTRDAFGLEVTNAAPETVAALDTFGHEWIAYGPDLGGVIAAATRDPSCRLATAYAALLHMSLEAAEGHAAAHPFLARLHDGQGPLTPREQAILEAALHWGAEAYGASLAAFERAVSHAPGDIVAAKWGQYLAFNLGDAGAMLRLGQAVATTRPDIPESWGMLAFAREQSHDLGRAEAAARKALAMKPSEAWAQHALAHVFETTGRLDEGIAMLEAAAPAWATRSIFMAGHNYWHLALFNLDRDDPARALAIWDTHLWGRWPEFAQEQIGAISLLWRLELRGVDVGNRWQAVAAHVAARADEHLWPFHDMHYVHALARNGDMERTRTFLRTLAQKADAAGGVWSAVAAPLAGAIVDAAQGRFADAATVMEHLLPQLHLIGGSHAQRDIFVQAWIDAAFRAGQSARLRPVLEGRARARPSVGVHRRDLGRLG